MLAKLAAADRQPALALTDSNNLFGGLEFSDKLASAGVQPIVGLQLCVRFEPVDLTARNVLGRRPPSIVLLAASEEGYRNLMRLTSRAWLDMAPGDDTCVSLASLAGNAAGLIALTGGPAGPLDTALRDGRRDLATARFEQLVAAFGDRLYVELQRHGLDEERQVEPELIRLAYEAGVPLAAANEPYFAKPDDYEAHDALLAIADGRLVSDESRRRLTPQHGFKSRAEMGRLFADLPEALGSTVEIAMRCAFRPQTRKPILPRFGTVIGEGDVDEAAELRRRAGEGLAARLAALGPAPGLQESDYASRLDFELSVIERMNYPGLFPHRRRLHPVGEGAGDPGWSGPRLRRGLACRLFAHHHRPRSAPLRAPVRALPQPRSRVDAGF